jgi:hypothetical protein
VGEGGLVYCIEYLTSNLDWLEEAVGDFGEDYLLGNKGESLFVLPNSLLSCSVDMPGQVELYTHYKHVNAIARTLAGAGYMVCSVYLIDSRFLVDPATFISATLMAMACQINLELTHFTLMSKMDIARRDKLVAGRDLENYLQPDPDYLLSQLSRDTSERFKGLNGAMCELLGDYRFVSVSIPSSIMSTQRSQWQFGAALPF